MKKFSFLKLTADIIEWITYLDLTICLVIVIFAATSSTDLQVVRLAGGLGLMVVLWLFISLPKLVVAHLIRLRVLHYETSHELLEVQRDILSELKSNNRENNSLSQLEFKSWVLNNPGKSINDFWAEKNTTK